MSDLLDHLLDPQPIAAIDAEGDLAAWLRRARAETDSSLSELDRSLLLAARAPSAAHAFAVAHQGALHHLLPDLPLSSLAAFCVSEDRGPHPRHIAATLSEVDPGDPRTAWRLCGRKRWATLAPISDLLVVIASIGWEEGRNRLRAAKIPPHRPGVTVEPLDAGERGAGLPHAVLHFQDVEVAIAEIEPGDAFTALVKPFRLYEDLFGAAACEAVALAVGRRHSWPHVELESACALILALRELVTLDPRAASTQIAAAGALELAVTSRGRRRDLWERLPPTVGERLGPAGGLLSIASEARQRRRDRAWERLGE